MIKKDWEKIGKIGNYCQLKAACCQEIKCVCTVKRIKETDVSDLSEFLITTLTAPVFR